MRNVNMLNSDFWLNIANYITGLDNNDTKLLANQYAGYWVTSKMSKRLDNRLIDLVSQLNVDVLTNQSTKAKEFIKSITNACDELGIKA